MMLSGCFFGGGHATNNGGSDDDVFTGTLTFTNQTSEPLCGVEFVQGEQSTRHMDRVEPGASFEIEVHEEQPDVFITSCDGSGFLYSLHVAFHSSTYVFSETEPQTFQERFDYLRQQNRMTTGPVLDDAGVQAQLQAAIVAKAQEDHWADTPSVTLIAGQEWGVIRHRLTGVIIRRRIAGVVGQRYPDGHCMIQVHTFTQAHDGSDFSEPVRFESTAGALNAGCTMVDWMEAQAGGGGGAAAASPAASSGGGSCSNTCSSANDNECDDGGPGAEYSVCALGTDCADCGAR